jgi:hypothetical protein
MSDVIDIDGINEFAELTGATLSIYSERAPFRVYQLEWPNGDWVRLYRNGTWVHGDWLQTDRTQGRFAHLMEVAPAFFGERGMTHLSTSHGGADEASLRVGWEHGTEHAHGYLLYDISKGRYLEYAAWKRGENREPIWHAELERG